MKKLLFLLAACALIMLLGCAMVTITVDLDNPYPVTMIWNGKEIEPAPGTDDLPAQTLEKGGAIVEAKIKDSACAPVIPDSYEWYLNGNIFNKGSSKVTIEDNLAIGTYQLSVIVQKDSVLSSTQLQFVVPE